MSDKSGIEWTDATWNCITGCTKVSPGCDHCYAETFAERWRGVPDHHFENGFDVTIRPDRLDQPLRWRKPRRIFVNSMSDLFHEAVPDEFIARMFAVMALTPRHTYQVLTKRHGRMRSLLSDARRWPGLLREGLSWLADHADAPMPSPDFDGAVIWMEGADRPGESIAPLLNVWLGVSAEDQHWADIRIPALLGTPAAVRFVSLEPLLGPIRLPFINECDGCTCGVEPGGYYGMHERGCGTEPGPAWGNLHWVIAGGESGPGARRCEMDWLSSLRMQCAEAGVPYFCKQLGTVLGRELGAGRKGGDLAAFPDDLRVREFPRAAAEVPA